MRSIDRIDNDHLINQSVSASVMLLGSISRRTMLELLCTQLSDEARKKEAERRIRLAIETIDRHFREAQDTVRGKGRDYCS